MRFIGNGTFTLVWLQLGTVRTVVRGREHRPLKGAATAQGQQL